MGAHGRPLSDPSLLTAGKAERTANRLHFQSRRHVPRTVSDQMGTITARQWQAPPPVSPNAACLWVRNERDLAITVRGLRLRVRSGAVAAATIIPPHLPDCHQGFGTQKPYRGETPVCFSSRRHGHYAPRLPGTGHAWPAARLPGGRRWH